MKHLIIVLLFALHFNAFSQDADKTVTLVVSGIGKTQDEAKQNALRSAIEQAFGAFISSKTEILNDNLVKDEIVSVANGNIQKFEILSEVQIPDGGFATTLNATVSISKLTSFVESKGVVAEFKGSILAANVKQQMLNEQNEIKSISSIVNTCKEILDLSTDFEIVRGEPKQINNDNNRWSVPLKINIKFNNNIQQFKQYFITSIKGLSMSPDEVEQYNKLGKKTYKLLIGDSISSGKTDNIEYLKTMAGGSSKFSYKIKCLGYPASKYSSNDLNKTIDMFNELEKKKHANCRGYHEIEYNEEKFGNGYNFRTENALISIIDLFHYTIHSLLNFEVTNGIDIFNPSRFVKGIDRYDPSRFTNELHRYLKIESDNLNVILFQNEPFGIFQSFSGLHRNSIRCY